MPKVLPGILCLCYSFMGYFQTTRKKFYFTALLGIIVKRQKRNKETKKGRTKETKKQRKEERKKGRTKERKNERKEERNKQTNKQRKNLRKK